MTDDILFAKQGRIGLITLNRPQALNALTRAMCVALHRQLMDWAIDDDVQAVVIEGAGGKAFCAGGDVVAMHRDGQAGSPDFEGFFHDEYRMNQAIAHYPKPYIALIDGISMGGGVGISVHAPYRVATEKTLFAMPETGIGLIPDVGGTHALPRFPGEFGTWAGLTGARVKGGDCVAIGYCTHYTPSAEISVLKERLAISHEPFADVLGTFHTDPGHLTLPALRDGIDYLFSQNQVEDILSLLDEGDDWAMEQAAIIRRMSPTSLKLTLYGLRAGEGASIEQALKLEYRMVNAIKQGYDFYEGVRAQLIDKDRSPKWSPARLEDVDIAPYLVEPAGGDLRFD
ncbi:enoyl-CoA hydratase/isomerase family protein [Sandaracinobacter neustonicus]|uniref:3-hydroxyisobutyryl-CoA hydrolase n=1 Tax=Sandaracinobacter neustonicus TaxID=1715348 RepID=A0A501XNI0_9SPHN|nr:enoyl-CoA hydratase/isomerase family protein [Sandaracinobacter neustonicus]TPE61843.1 enoyl-CoA hydratase/isomerase family protein [Sandaracinobacter neustonicus]